MRGRLLQRLFEELRADLRVLVARRPAHAVAERGVAARGARERREDAPLRLDDRLRAILLDEELFEERGGRLVRRIGPVRAGQEPLDLGRGEPLGDARRPQVEPRARRPRGAFGLLDQRREVRLEAALVDLRVAEPGARVLALAAGGAERLRVGGGRLLPVAGVAEHVAELDEQLGRHGLLLGVLQLQLEELLHHVDLAEAPVDVASLAQRVEQRRVELVRVLEVLQRAHRVEELVLEHAAELQVIRRLRRGVGIRGNAALQLLGEPLPIVNRLEMIQTLRKIHSYFGLGQPGRARGPTRKNPALCFAHVTGARRARAGDHPGVRITAACLRGPSPTSATSRTRS
ncbi:MAG: hypothetical protein QM820_41645 [Minicystis sp.]